MTSLAEPREDPERSEAVSLTIAVLTYQRPRDIAAIIPLLVEQALLAAHPGFDIDILVVDNDPSGHAFQAVDQLALELAGSVTIRYENETVPGISAARNRALAASDQRDLLVFIDDDERPSAGWLQHLLSEFRRTPCVGVVGPVVSQYEVPPEPWIEGGRFFRRRRLPTGTKVEVAATNNLLIDLRWVRSHGLRFDLDFGITGGDDTMFTRSIHRLGGVMVWCDEAIVLDIVPRKRISRRWVVLRALSSGNSWALTSLKLEEVPAKRLAARLQLTAEGGVRIAGGIGRIWFGTIAFKQDQRARGVRTVARGAGMVLGAYGYRYREYKRR